MQDNNAKQSEFTKDFVAGLGEINKLEKGANLVSVVCAMLKHIGPHVKSVKFSGTREIRKPNAHIEGFGALATNTFRCVVLRLLCLVSAANDGPTMVMHVVSMSVVIRQRGSILIRLHLRPAASNAFGPVSHETS